MNFIKEFFSGMGIKGIAAQAIGFVAMALLVYSFQKNTQKGILKLQMASESLWVVHYLLIGAYTGMALNFVGVARCYVYANRETKKWAGKSCVPVLFFVISVAACALTWNGPASLLPMTSVCLSSFVLWSKNPRIIRFFSVPSCACWLIFNIISGSYAGVLTEILNIASIAVGIARYDIGKHKKQQPELAAAVYADDAV